MAKLNRFIYKVLPTSPSEWLDTPLELQEFLLTAKDKGVEEYALVAECLHNDLCKPEVVHTSRAMRKHSRKQQKS